MISDQKDMRIFAGASSIAFAKRMCTHLGVELGQGYVKRFSEGNTFVKVAEKVRGKDVYIVQSIGLDPNNQLMELLFWIDAFKRASAESVTAIVPFFSYAKGDKKDEPRVSIRARVCADCLEAAGVDRIITMDLHSPQIQGFFKIPVDHLYGMKTVCGHVRAQGIDNLVVVAPDVGFAKNARKYADLLGATVAIGDKTRAAHDERAQVLGIIGDVRGKNALIVDDFTISCGTLAGAAQALQKQGAQRIFAAVTHSLLNEDGLSCLNASPIERLVTTDTVENPAAFDHPKVAVASVSELFARAIKTIHLRESLSRLFD